MCAKNLAIVTLLAMTMMGNVACADANARVLAPVPTAKDIARKPNPSAVVDGNNKFAFDLYGKLRTTDGNIFFSPYSISTALAMTYAGARGDTEKQMTQTLHFSLPPETLHPGFGAVIDDLNSRSGKGHVLLIANALWGQQGYDFLKPFLSLTQMHYDSGLNEVDFANDTEAARKKINAWVEGKTHNRIKELIKPGVLKSLTRLVLTNAIYFKGTWATQFKEAQTKSAPFTLATGEKIQAPMMNQSSGFNYYEDVDSQVLELPYDGDDLVMTIFLPKKTNGLAALEAALTTDKLAQCLPQFRKAKVTVSLPKFKMTSQFSLVEVLKAMGMPDAFSAKADFSGMNGRKDLYISEVLHKAFVEVNEEGTEAAAATAVVVARKSVSIQRPLFFRADHPFCFMIRDTKTESVLFMGRVMNPTL